jgi:hypothetical protein
LTDSPVYEQNGHLGNTEAAAMAQIIKLHLEGVAV